MIVKSHIPFNKGDKIIVVVKKSKLHELESYDDVITHNDDITCTDSFGVKYDRETGACMYSKVKYMYRAIHTKGYA